MSDHREGPVRSEAARIAILETTARLFVERGHDNLTIEGVAAEARVGKQTIYRWWPSKGALVADCLLSGFLLPDRLTPPDTGDVRADLITWLDQIVAIFSAAGGDELMRSLIAAAADNADVGQRIEETVGATSALTARLRVAVEAGQLSPDAPLKEIGDMFIGAIILRSLSRAVSGPEATARLVAAVIPA